MSKPKSHKILKNLCLRTLLIYQNYYYSFVEQKWWERSLVKRAYEYNKTRYFFFGWRFGENIWQMMPELS